MIQKQTWTNCILVMRYRAKLMEVTELNSFLDHGIFSDCASESNL